MSVATSGLRKKAASAFTPGSFKTQAFAFLGCMFKQEDKPGLSASNRLNFGFNSGAQI